MSQKNSEPIELSRTADIFRLELRIASITEELGHVYRKEVCIALSNTSSGTLEGYRDLYKLLLVERDKLRTELLLIKN